MKVSSYMKIRSLLYVLMTLAQWVLKAKIQIASLTKLLTEVNKLLNFWKIVIPIQKMFSSSFGLTHAGE